MSLKLIFSPQSSEGFDFAPQWMLLGFAFGGNLYFMWRTVVFVFGPIFMFCSIIDCPKDVDAMNIISFGYLGCFGGTLKMIDIGDNDLEGCRMRCFDILSNRCNLKLR